MFEYTRAAHLGAVWDRPPPHFPKNRKIACDARMACRVLHKETLENQKFLGRNKEPTLFYSRFELSTLR
jgi:hypothetical protein